MLPESPQWDFKPRDIAILKELAKNPQRSARELEDTLQTEYDIDVSHVTISKAIREMREAGVFRETIVPNEEFLQFAFFEFKFNPEYFAEEWRSAMEYIKNHKNTFAYYLADGEYQWGAIMMFPSHTAESRWIHEFYKKHGKLVNNLRNTTMINMMKFEMDPRLFESLGGHEFTDRAFTACGDAEDE